MTERLNNNNLTTGVTSYGLTWALRGRYTLPIILRRGKLRLREVEEVCCTVLTKQLPSLVLSTAMAGTWKGTGGWVSLEQDPCALQLVSGEGTGLPAPPPSLLDRLPTAVNGWP